MLFSQDSDDAEIATIGMVQSLFIQTLRAKRLAYNRKMVPRLWALFEERCPVRRIDGVAIADVVPDPDGGLGHDHFVVRTILDEAVEAVLESPAWGLALKDAKLSEACSGVDPVQPTWRVTLKGRLVVQASFGERGIGALYDHFDNGENEGSTEEGDECANCALKDISLIFVPDDQQKFPPVRMPAWAPRTSNWPNGGWLCFYPKKSATDDKRLDIVYEVPRLAKGFTIKSRAREVEDGLLLGGPEEVGPLTGAPNTFFLQRDTVYARLTPTSFTFLDQAKAKYAYSRLVVPDLEESRGGNGPILGTSCSD